MKYFPQECILTSYQLKALCDEWKIILGLENWHMAIMLVKQREIDGLQGQCEWSLIGREAPIKILRHDNFDADYFDHDMEKVLVHEMLHCVFGDISDADAQLEQNIDLLANALVGLKRESNVDNKRTKQSK